MEYKKRIQLIHLLNKTNKENHLRIERKRKDATIDQSAQRRQRRRTKAQRRLQIKYDKSLSM
jgi:hypothetical protein